MEDELRNMSLRQRIAEDLPGYPPVPLPSEAQTPGELMDSLYGHFSYMITYLRDYFARSGALNESSRAHVLRSLGEMEQLLPSLQRRDPQWMPEQWRRAMVLCVFVAELATWANDGESVRCFAAGLASDLKQWVALATALVENELHGWKDWRESDDPVAWVRCRTKQIFERDYELGGQVKSRDALYRTPKSERERAPGPSQAALEESLRFDSEETFRDTVPLEVATGLLDRVAMTLEQVVFRRRYGAEAIEQLQRAAANDPQLLEYIRHMVKRGANKRAVWRGLGWDNRTGERIDRRYRRLRHRIRAKSATWIARIERVAGLSDASRTVLLEPLYDGRKGTKVAEWKHTHP